MTYILTSSAICPKLHTGFISFDSNTEFSLKAQLKCRPKVCIVWSLSLSLLRESDFTQSKCRKKLLFHTIKMTYI